ncbi:hypothetical protein RN001_006192 [Aquatica leii]|uniref:Integrase zinc-binding domain-containing protein n=1 Tax=Aquatica leii TaxID=1421715 RepID=A0AAN7QKU9_9COLE|nr:hypothetical protein RN001_006192 [Aquatica leii]
MENIQDSQEIMEAPEAPTQKMDMSMLLKVMQSIQTGQEEMKAGQRVVKRKEEEKKLKELMRNLEDKQKEDKHLNWIIKELEEDKMNKGEELKKNFRIQGGLLFRRGSRSEDWWTICVPSKIEKEVIKVYHEMLGHFGTQKIVSSIKENCYITNLGKKLQFTKRS